MRVSLVAAAAALFFVTTGVVHADAPQLNPPFQVYDGSLPLEVDIMSACTVVDWNNDMKKDLVVSQFTQGKVWLFVNQGTDTDPVFNGGSEIESGGTPITTSYG